MKNFINKNKGITLIALIITIIVMLILAGITISMIVGEDGIIARAEKAGEERRGATVEEHRDIWKSSLNTDAIANTSNAQTLEEVVADLKEGKVITEEEADKILDKGYVVIGSRTIIFRQDFVGDYVEYKYDEVEGGAQIDEKYLNNVSNLGNTVKQNKNLSWRVFYQKDNKLFIIPVDGDIYDNNCTVKNGANFFNNSISILNDVCESLYSNINLGLKARSINIKDMDNILTAEAKKEKEYYINNTENKITLNKYPDVLNYYDRYEYESEPVYVEYTDKEFNTGEIEILCSFNYNEEDFIEKSSEVLDSEYIQKYESMGVMLAYRKIDTNKILSVGKIMPGPDIGLNNAMVMGDGRVVTGSTRVHVMPIVEIDLSRYKLENDSNDLEKVPGSDVNPWKIKER